MASGRGLEPVGRGSEPGRKSLEPAGGHKQLILSKWLKMAKKLEVALVKVAAEVLKVLMGHGA